MSVTILGRPNRRRVRGQGEDLLRDRVSPPATPINATGVSETNTTTFVVTYDQAVRLCATPRYRIGSAVPTAAREASPTQVELTYAAGTGGDAIVIPFGDAGVTNATGGRVNPGEFGLALAAEQPAAEPVPALKAA